MVEAFLEHLHDRGHRHQRKKRVTETLRHSKTPKTHWREIRWNAPGNGIFGFSTKFQPFDFTVQKPLLPRVTRTDTVYDTHTAAPNTPLHWSTKVCHLPSEAPRRVGDTLRAPDEDDLPNGRWCGDGGCGMIFAFQNTRQPVSIHSLLRALHFSAGSNVPCFFWTYSQWTGYESKIVREKMETIGDVLAHCGMAYATFRW